MVNVVICNCSVVENLNDVYEISNIFHFIWSSAAICCAGFLVLVSRDVSGLVRYTFAITLLVLQLFSVGWMGDNLMRTVSCLIHKFTWQQKIIETHFPPEKSSNLSNGVYNGDWFKANYAYVKDLKFVIQICQQPRTVKLYRFSNASYSTCSSVSLLNNNWLKILILPYFSH